MNYRRIKSLAVDSLIVLMGIIGSLFFIFLFQRDLNATLSRLGEQPVGTISFRYNTAQRRFIDRLVWDRLRNESPVYNGDIIRTAGLSEATITFAYGDIIDLSSNTLIQIFSDAGGGRIDFSGGGISVNTSSDAVGGRSMVISTAGQNVTVESGAVVRASSLDGGAFDLSVSEGAVVLQNTNSGETLSVESGFGVTLSARGEAIAAPQAVAVSPSPDSRLLTQSAGGARVRFNWNTINYPSGALTRLEIAYDRSFNRIYYAENLSANNLEIELPPGDLFWRLYPVTAQTESSPAQRPYSKLTIVHSAVPVPLSPAALQVFNYRSSFPQVRFQWTASSQAQVYLFEAADNLYMNSPALALQVRSPAGDIVSYATSALGQGTWYWRVTPVYGREFAGEERQSSVTQSFIIQRGALLSAPVLTAPLQDAVLNIEAGRRDILFSWRRENEAASYTIRVSSSSDMRVPVIEQTVTETFYRYGASETALTAGAWYWTVTQTGQEGDVSSPSQPRSFTAMRGEIVQRAVFPPDNYTIADNLLPDTRFTWKTNLSDTRFQVSPNESFTTLLIDESANGEVYTIRLLENGSYYWRITGGIGSQRLESSPRRFTVAPSLPAPVLIRPQGEAVTREGSVVIADGQPVVFNWLPVAGAEYYAFRLYSGTEEQNSVYEATVYGTNQNVNMDAYENGWYTWSVQAYARETPLSTRRTGLTAVQSVNIIRLRPVVLQNPRSAMEYDGVSAYLSPDTVQWSSPLPPAENTVIIARDAQMTDIVFSRANAPYSFVMPRLTEGYYYWTVRARTAEGLDISAAVPFRFRVLPLPPITLQNPRNGMEYDGVSASRSPDTLQWSPPVSPAESTVTIARDAQMTDVVFSSSSSSVMPRLTEGYYYWTARARTAEGMDMSAASPNRFRVLPIPPLPAPANRRPANGHTITAQMIRESRMLDFSWNSVQGANGYILTVFQGSGGLRTTVIQTPVFTETSYHIEDLRILGRGEFFWQVEAVYVFDDDFIEQRGHLTENRLIMDIPAPRQIDTRDTGILYGR